MKKSKLLAGLLAGVMMVSSIHVMPAMADARKVVTLGANLSDEQKQDILRFFGVSEAEVDIITITNDDERAQLGNLIPLEQIGTRTFSCALVSPTQSGGIQAKTANMNYVTSNMIAATLSTSGVVNCDVLAAAPFEVSGTGALTGVMMAYETASGETLDQEKKELANEELVTTGTIAETIGQDEATLVVNDIKIHIIRDQVKEESQVQTVVDDVITVAETAMETRAAETGTAAPAKLTQDDHQVLYNFGYKVGQMDYHYDDVKVTLQRVAQNVMETTGIDDPIKETFDVDLSDNALSQDSVLRGTDDQALGDQANVNSTVSEADAAAPAAAGSSDVVSLAPAATIGNCDWVDGTNLIVREGANGYYLATVDGTAVTPDKYRSYFYYSRGYITCELPYTDNVNISGLLNKSGQEIVPCQYGDVDILGGNWVAGAKYVESDSNNYDKEWTIYGSENKTLYMLIDTVDFYHINADGTASLAGTLPRANYMDADGHGDYVTIENRADGTCSLYDATFNVVQTGLSSTWDTGDIVTDTVFKYSENGHQGLKDAAGNILLAPAYQYINDFEADYVNVSNGEKEGLMDMSGNVIVPVEYDDVISNYYAPTSDRSRSYAAGGYFAVVQDGKLGYVDINGNLTMQPTYSKDILDVYGASALLTDLEGNVHILAADGVDTVLNGYDNVYPMYYGSGYLYKATDANSDYSLIDWHGNVLMGPGFSDADLSGDGTMLLVEPEWGADCQLYNVTWNYPQRSAQPAPAEQPAAETPAEAPAEQPATEAPAEQPAVEAPAATDANGILLSNIQALIDGGLDANRLAISTLLGQVASNLQETNPAAAAVYNSAKTLVDGGSTDTGALGTLMQTAAGMLG